MAAVGILSAFTQGMSQVKSRIKIAVFLCLSLVLIRGEAGLKHGPFPIKRSPIAEMTYTFVRKLEVEATASQLASSSIDGTIKLLNDVVIAISETEMKTYRAGTVLNPTLNPSDDILIPAGVTVSNPASVDGSIASGRFAYLGNAPRFQPENLEMVASKMGHSLRVKAWVSQDTIDGYELALLTRFKGFYDSFMLPTMHFEILESLVSIAKNTQNVNTKKWATVASYYSKHFLENQAVDIYSKTSAEDQYKEIILT